MIAEHFQHQGIQLVAGPTMGGIILAYEVARQLGVRSSFAEGEGKHRVFKRFTIAPGELCLVVDDILTTGDSIHQVMVEVHRHGGEVMGVGVLVDRSGGEIDFGVPLFSCCQVFIPTYSPQDCPLCRAKVPLSRPGSSAHL
jgi:orotate phosphoribosyltransferase